MTPSFELAPLNVFELIMTLAKNLQVTGIIATAFMDRLDVIDLQKMILRTTRVLTMVFCPYPFFRANSIWSSGTIFGGKVIKFRIYSDILFRSTWDTDPVSRLSIWLFNLK